MDFDMADDMTTSDEAELLDTVDSDETALLTGTDDDCSVCCVALGAHPVRKKQTAIADHKTRLYILIFFLIYSNTLYRFYLLEPNLEFHGFDVSGRAFD